MTRVPAAWNAGIDLRTGTLLVATVAAVLAAFAAGAGPRAHDRLLAAPELPEPVQRCNATPARALRRAADAAHAAEAHDARYPFAPAEGMRALALLAEARDCLALAGSNSGAAALAERAAQQRSRIAGDYRDHLTRLRRAIALDSLALARDDVRYLRALLGERDDPFGVELRALELELDAHAASAQEQP